MAPPAHAQPGAALQNPAHAGVVWALVAPYLPGGQGVAPGVIGKCNVASVRDANSRQSLTCGGVMDAAA